MIDALYDMETQDPDDLFALALLASHPHVSLRAVTVTPGYRHQVGTVRSALKRLCCDVPVGAYNPDHEKVG